MAKRIDISDMSVYYGTFKAVEDVNLSVEPRSVTALIGPSGCGKSTVLRSLNRMHEVLDGARVEGKVLLDGVTPAWGQWTTTPSGERQFEVQLFRNVSIEPDGARAGLCLRRQRARQPSCTSQCAGLVPR